MKLPTPPEPAMLYVTIYGDAVRCHNETQLLEYGRQCAEKMREACAAECDDLARLYKEQESPSYKQVADACAEAIRALEIEDGN
jgi:hypothetical protein